MNKPAYLTTNYAIKALTNLLKADVIIHGQDNIPDGPTIFVINHFTRMETLLIPYYIYNLTEVPALSLASETLFKGGLKTYFDLVGVVSTKDPDRDKIIIRGLLTGSENWIIFPEGRMVKTKKIMGKEGFVIRHAGGKHKPHTGAASLALRTEFFRRHLLQQEKIDPGRVTPFLNHFEIDSINSIKDKNVSIVPVNLTYYPIRAKENIATQFASRLMRDVPARMMEELMTEGTMLFSGVDLDINFGKPMNTDAFMESEAVQRECELEIGSEPDISEELSRKMKDEANIMMEEYMKAIYDMTTINHEHLFASFLKLYPYSRIKEMDLRRKVYFAAEAIRKDTTIRCNLHRSLLENQIHLLTDDRFKKAENFLQLSLEKGVVKKLNGYFQKVGGKITDLLPFDRGRIENPVKVIVNEVEPLTDLLRIVRKIALQPDFLIKFKVTQGLLRDEKNGYLKDCRECASSEISSGGPYLLPAVRRRIGVVLVHSYLSVPEEVRALSLYLRKKGYWVYAPRLAGHGTSADDLARKQFTDWQLSVERGYAIMSSICEKVVLGGVSVGGCLAFDLAAQLPQVAGVFAVCPPLRLKDYSTNFMPGLDVWNRIMSRLKRDNLEGDFFTFTSENNYINYEKNPIYGVKEVGNFLSSFREKLSEIYQPSLILHADKDPVVASDGAEIMYDEIGAEKKEFILINSNKHVIVNGDGAERVYELISSFIKGITR